MYDVIVVGAGPSGCEVARLISKNGYEVLVVEEHSKIGIPTQCAGLVSFRIGKIPKKLILNKVKVAKFCCKNSCFYINSKRPMYVIDRRGYDLFLAENAKKAGAEFKLKTRFLSFKNGKVVTSKRKFLTKILVGADGPNSSVARSLGIKLPRNLLRAVQARVKSNFEQDTVELWFGSNIAPNNFAWVVPENERIARVGLACSNNPNQYFEKFLKKRFGKVKIIDRIGDVIRYGLIEKSAADNVLLVGDAACQVKPFSLGGLIYGKIGAKFAAKACIEALENNDFSENFLLKNYDFEWKRKLKLPIIKGIVIKKIFSLFQDNPTFFKTIEDINIAKLASFLDVDLL